MGFWDALASAAQAVGDAVEAVADVVVDTIEDAIDGAADVATDVIDGASDTADRFLGPWLSWPVTIAAGFVNSVIDTVRTSSNAFLDVIDDACDVVADPPRAQPSSKSKRESAERAHSELARNSHIFSNLE